MTSNFSSLVVFLLGGMVYIPLGLAAGVFSIAGHDIGAYLAMKNGSRFVRMVILGVITLLFITKTFYTIFRWDDIEGKGEKKWLDT